MFFNFFCFYYHYYPLPLVGYLFFYVVFSFLSFFSFRFFLIIPFFFFFCIYFFQSHTKITLCAKLSSCKYVFILRCPFMHIPFLVESVFIILLIFNNYILLFFLLIDNVFLLYYVLFLTLQLSVLQYYSLIKFRNCILW